jgi:hypothetical protein
MPEEFKIRNRRVYGCSNSDCSNQFYHIKGQIYQFPSFDALNDRQQTVYLDKAAELLQDLHWCERVWEAWWVGTMTEADFIKADEDDNIVWDTAEQLYKFVQEMKNGQMSKR